MYLLDTDTLTLAHAEHPRVSQRIRHVDPNGLQVENWAD